MTKTKTANAKKPAPVAATPAPQTRPIKPHEMLLAPSIQNAVNAAAWGKFAGAVELRELVEDLRKQVKDVADGNLRPVEAMLYGQAVALQTIFTSLSRRAASNDGLKQFQVNLTLALKAQAQCRATLEALAEIKNPRPVAFVKQANIANGPQQINNAATANRTEADIRSTHARQNAGTKNELLEHEHGERLDARTAGATGGADPRLEAMETGHRTAHT